MLKTELGKFRLWDWQVKDLQALAAGDYVGLLSVEPGGGKTLAAAAAWANLEPEVTLIIAPLSTHQTAWIDTFVDAGLPTPRVIGSTRKAEREAMFDFEWGYPGIYLISPQLFTRSDVTEWAGDLLITDEAHQLGNPGKLGQRKLSGYNVTDDPINKRFPHRLALSGTPARNKFENLWSIAKFLWPEQNKSGQIAYHNHYMWKYQRMTSAEIRTGYDKKKKKVTTATNWIGEREPGRLFSEMPTVIQHFRRDQCCEHHPEGFLDMPEPQELIRTVELLPAQRKAIRDLEKHALTWLDENPLAAKLPMTQAQRIRQICLGVPTVEWVTEKKTLPDGEVVDSERAIVTFDEDCKSPLLDLALQDMENLAPGEPVVVFMESQRFARVAVERFRAAGYEAFEYSGQVNKAERAENLAKFGTPEGHQVLVGVLSSIGTGTDGIQKVCNTEMWFERSVDNVVNSQGEGRADRLGARSQVQRYIYQDSEGYAAGRHGKQLSAMLKLRASTTKPVKRTA